MTSTIKSLKDKLVSLENNYDHKLKELEQRESKETRLDSKLKEIITLQNDIITFNISGEYIQISKQLINNTPYDNIFRDVISSMEDMGRDLEEIQNVFIDRNPKGFFYILEIMRKGFNQLLRSESIESSLKLPRNINHEAFLEDVQFYFKQDGDKVLDDFGFFYNKDKVRVELNSSGDLIIKYTLSSELPNDMLTPYRAHNIRDIKKQSSHKAFFVNYDSNIVFELSEIHMISQIEVKPFTFDMDCWYPGEGAGTFVFSSLDNVEWDFLNAIPDDYGIEHDNTYLINFDRRMAKYIKFQTGDYTLSIAYMKIA